MQDQKMNELLEQLRELDEQARPCWEAIAKFAGGEYVCLGIHKDLILEIGAKPNEVGNVSTDTVYEVYVEGDKLVVKVLQDPGDVVCDGNCDGCPIQNTDCDEDCANCPCKDYCDDCEVATE